MGAARKSKHELADEIVRRLARRHSTAVVLFHHAVAERLGLGPTDHKCLDLLRERGAMAGSDLCAITGLTSGAITGVVARLERAGYIRREPDPHDGRKQILHLGLERSPIQDVIAPLRKDVAALLENFDTHQLTAIAEKRKKYEGPLTPQAIGGKADNDSSQSRPGQASCDDEPDRE